MLEFMHLCRSVPCGLGAGPLDESLLPVVRIALVFGFTTVSWGVWIARALIRSWKRGEATGSSIEDPREACRLHDWLSMEDGGFVCLRCGFQAGSITSRQRD